MKSIGLDTSVVVRLIMGEPESQAAAALRYVERRHYDGVQVCVSDMVIGEVYFALIYHYEVPDMEAVSALREFLMSPMITPLGHALSVLDGYRGKGAGLMDRLIRNDLLDKVHTVITFDKDFARLDNVCLVQ